ncbi:hypothetical protein BIW11_02994, partial [Tropilaelaps mercedesae]
MSEQPGSVIPGV